MHLRNTYWLSASSIGLVDPDSFAEEPTTDGMPYTSLLYANGPGYTSPRQNLTDVLTGTSTVSSSATIITISTTTTTIITILLLLYIITL